MFDYVPHIFAYVVVLWIYNIIWFQIVIIIIIIKSKKD